MTHINYKEGRCGMKQQSSMKQQISRFPILPTIPRMSGFSTITISRCRRWLFVGLLGVSPWVLGTTINKDYELQGQNAKDKFGDAVTVIGDINGDHVKDFAVASPANSDNGFHAGKVQVFSGKTRTVLRTHLGSQAGDQFGSALAAPGDVDGDGVPDLVVGAPQNDPLCSTTGCETTWPYTFELDDAEYPKYRLIRSGNVGDAVVLRWSWGGGFNMRGGLTRSIGLYESGNCGSSCTITLKDPAEVVLSRTLTWTFGQPAAGYAPGYVRVYSGATGQLIWHFTGDTAGDHFGISVAGGDLDGDGRAELVVGADGKDTTLVRAGQAKVFSGSTGQLLYQKTGLKAGDLFGLHVAVVDDANGDGKRDVAVAAPRADVSAGVDAGAVSVYAGSSGVLLYTLTGNDPMDRFGSSIAEQNNGNGNSKLLVGAPQAGVCWGSVVACGRSGTSIALTINSQYTVTPSSGQADQWVIEKNGIVVLTAGFGAYSTMSYGSTPGNYYRIWLEKANGQYYDIVSNIVEYTPGKPPASTGQGYVSRFNLANGSLETTYDGDNRYDQYSSSIDSTDVDQDGVKDIVIAAVTDNVSGNDSGSVHIVSGSNNSSLHRMDGVAGDNKGKKVVVEDLDSDGQPEILVSSPQSATAAGKGKLEVFTVEVPDIDGDGVDNPYDAFPQNPLEWLDTDSDGTGNNADLDDDGDNVPDYIDAEPLNPAVSVELIFPVEGGQWKGSQIKDSNILQ